jgi:hypothetical protein
MCLHTSKKNLKPVTKSFGAKYFHKNSYTIPKGPLEERHGEQAKAMINASIIIIIIIIIALYHPSPFHACNSYQTCQLNGAT